MYKKIFEAGNIGSLELKNRLVVPPMLTEYADEHGRLTERYIRYYEEKAKGGWGLIICEDNAVTEKGVGFKNLPGIWSHDMMPEHVELVNRVHAAGAKIAVQLYHAGRQSHSSLLGERPVAPSPIQDPVMGETPRELSTDEVQALIVQFGDAAKRAKDADYDAVEIHGAHGYLINQFMSPFSNKRTDIYGGNFNNRMRFPLKIVQRIRKEVGPDYPIIFRLSGEELVEGGLTIEDTKTIAMVLENEGIDALHVSGGVYKSAAELCAPTAMATAAFSNYAKEIKKVIEIPVLTVNKIMYPQVAESLLREGKADFISMGRASIADPYLPLKTLENREDEIIHCIGCRQGCWNHLLENKPVSCLVNPLTGKEGLYDLESVENKKKVVVVGGGPTGMEAAIVAARRGHKVTLYEKSTHLGGQWLLAALPPGKELLNTLTVWQKSELKRLGVKVILNHDVTNHDVIAMQPDHVIIATGSNPIVPNIPGSHLAHVKTANDVLAGHIDIAGKVIVIGGGLVGVETAEHIAVHNQSVEIVEMQSEIAGDMEGGAKYFLMKSIEANKVAVHTETRVKEIKDGEVIVVKNDQTYSLAADLVVMAIGSSSENHLADGLYDHISYDIVGDAFEVGKAQEGIQKAYDAAMAI